MKRVRGPVHAVAVTPWRESRARPWTTALPTAQGYGQPLRGSAVAHRLPTSFAFGLTRRCASCPNDTHHRSFPRHRYSHRYTLPIYNGSTRFALPIPGCFRLIPELEKTRTHVVLESECIDRMYLNVYVPQLQRVGGVVWYLRGHLGQRFASTATVAPKTVAFVASIEKFVAEQGVNLVSFGKHQRKDDITRQYLQQFDANEGILYVGR